jgi:hypothetical protein
MALRIMLQNFIDELVRYYFGTSFFCLSLYYLHCGSAETLAAMIPVPE